MTTKIETKFMSYEQWAEKYRPIENPNADHGGNSFDTHDPKDVAFIAGTDPLKIWTSGDGDGYYFINSGWHFVNRLEYYVTEVPYDDSEIVQVLLSREDECDCYDPEEYEGPSPDCKKCESSGYTVTYYTDEMIESENNQ